MARDPYLPSLGYSMRGTLFTIVAVGAVLYGIHTGKFSPLINGLPGLSVPTADTAEASEGTENPKSPPSPASPSVAGGFDIRPMAIRAREYNDALMRVMDECEWRDETLARVLSQGTKRELRAFRARFIDCMHRARVRYEAVPRFDGDAVFHGHTGKLLAFYEGVADKEFDRLVRTADNPTAFNSLLKYVANGEERWLKKIERSQADFAQRHGFVLKPRPDGG